MNLFPLERRGSGMVVRGTDGPILAPPTAGRLLGGIRPENLHLAEQGIAACVRHAEYLGADTVVACTVGDVPLLARLPGRVVLADGAPVCLATEEPIHLFDAASGSRVELAAVGNRLLAHGLHQGCRAAATQRARSGLNRGGLTMIRRRTLLAATAGMLAAPAILRAQTVQKLTFYYPIAVGGPLQAIIDGYCKAFQKETGIAVEPVYAGDYSQTLIKAMTAIQAGTGPQFAVLLAAEMHSLQDQDILVSLDEIGLDADGKKWLDGFYPAFMANSHADGKTWSVPFQRSTAIFYYNKAAFQDAGLDPEKFPTHLGRACRRRRRS